MRQVNDRFMNRANRSRAQEAAYENQIKPQTCDQNCTQFDNVVVVGCIICVWWHGAMCLRMNVKSQSDEICESIQSNAKFVGHLRVCRSLGASVSHNIDIPFFIRDVKTTISRLLNVLRVWTVENMSLKIVLYMLFIVHMKEPISIEEVRSNKFPTYYFMSEWFLIKNISSVFRKWNILRF